MRMRKKKNLVPRMERCGDRLIRDPYDRQGRWRELMPEARELRLELGCGKGRFTAGTAAAEPDVLFIAVEFAKICEDAGAAALTVHGRTRMQMFAPPVDLDIIRRVKEAVSIPVIGNGDIDSPEAAKRMYDETGCDLVMVGRAAMGNPWIFRRIEHYMQTGELLSEPTPKERMTVLKKHVELLCRYKGEYIGMREARKHSFFCH